MRVTAFRFHESGQRFRRSKTRSALRIREVREEEHIHFRLSLLGLSQRVITFAGSIRLQ